MTNGFENNPNTETALESWKEIATYLQRDVSTVIRWEKHEGLPVHRHRHLSRSSVYAYARELDAWRVQRTPAPELKPLWRRPLPASALAAVLLLSIASVGSGPYIGTTAQAADGIVTRQVWLKADGAWEGAPSPDGKYMSYLDWKSGNLGIRDLETETTRLLTNEGTWKAPAQFAEASKWSPDGKRLAYTWNVRGSGSELRIVAVDDPQPRVLIREEADGAWAGPQDWSPDGRHILVRFSTGPMSRQLALIPIEGGSPRVVKTFGSGSIASGAARFSPDGRYIVYAQTPAKVAAQDLFVLDVNTGVETPLVQHPADDCVFGWSPDGNWVLFLSDRAGTLDFWAIRVANGKPQGAPVRVKHSVGRVVPLGFAQDGSFYYFDVKVARDVYAARVDFQTGKVLAPAEKAIVRFEGSNMNPRYSPDGKSLAHISRRGSIVLPTARGNALCVHSLDTGAERVFMDEFARLGVRVVMGPRWSPDSRSIVVAGVNVGAGRGLYVIHLDTGEVIPAIEIPEGVSFSKHEWSSEERFLFYHSYDRNQRLSQIVELNLGTGQKRELYRFAATDDVSGIAASPNGEWLAARGEDGLLIMPRRGGTAREMRRIDLSGLDPRICTSPVWTPEGDYILLGGNKRSSEAQGVLYRVPLEGGQPQGILLQRRFWPGETLTVHPNGQQIAFTSVVNRDTDADVWVMQNFLPDSGAKNRPSEVH